MSESFRARLRRLRREGAGEAAEEDVARVPDAPSSAGEARRVPLTDRQRASLDAAREKRGGRGDTGRGDRGNTGRGSRGATGRAPREEDRDDDAPAAAPLWPRSTEPVGGLALVDADRGRFAARTTHFHETWRHGTWTLDEVDAADAGDFALLTGDDALARLDPRAAVYLDTETTGLSGGAGTSVFMIGLGRFVGDRFEMWQGFLRSPAEEPALLAECAARIADSGGVVSFFGKSFDRHRLEDKMRVHGVDPPFASVPHLDLCHPLRRLYRDALPDARLRTMESELVGVAREDDLPGAFAPEAWFDFLAGRPHRVEGVFQHNLDDVLSLATLAAHLGRSTVESRAGGEALSGDPAARAAAVAKSHLALRAREEALPWLDRAIERCGRADAARALELERAEALRLAKRDAESLAAYRALAAAPEDRHSVAVLLGLAKLVEHHGKDRAGALELCRTARATLDRQVVGGAYAKWKRELDARIARLGE